ncbi:TetR/AcrR family transcriptional regulator [Gaiella occulta]|uniref:TetR/AcrR family transcriptional regulator n=1 Tax=Gaiella occulta TaxID=1002870 RepID=UPI000E0A0EB5|nr:TetR/AcrR family transcriptional regulator [Gaiella occulta]
MTAASPSPRLPAAERRRQIVAAAQRVFASTSYAGATTALIAREAGVSEPLLYRHFPSKRELWFACLDAAWADLRAAVEASLERLAESNGELVGVDDVVATSPWRSPLLATLWIQGVTEAADDRELQQRVRRHLRQVHGFVAGLLRAAQERGLVPADRNPDAEAWIFVAGGLLRSVVGRLGGVLGDDDLAAIARERRRWLSGSA